jgi:hypothetical protein
MRLTALQRENAANALQNAGEREPQTRAVSLDANIEM